MLLLSCVELYEAAACPESNSLSLQMKRAVSGGPEKSND